MGTLASNKILSGRQVSGLTLASVALVYLASPAFSLSYLTWFWFIPVGIACLGSRPWQGALIMGGCACLFWALSIWWLLPAVIDFTGVNWLIALLLFVLVCFLCALPYAMFGLLLAQSDWLHLKGGALRASIIFTVVVSWIPSLIPGSHVHSLYQSPQMIQLLDLGGLPLLIFINIFFQFLLVKFTAVYLYQRQWALTELITAIAVFIVIISYGYIRIAQLEAQPAKDELLKVGIIQPNFFGETNTDRLFLMTEALSAANDKLDLIVWPELSAQFSIIEDEDDRSATLNLIRKIDTPLLLSSGYVFQRNEMGQAMGPYYNASHLIAKDGSMATYYKRTLVPFFEFLPLRNRLMKWFPEALNYVPGKEPVIFSLTDTIKIIPVICYEVIFSRDLRQFVENGANIIINPSSDTWFGDSPGSAHHLSLALFRSVEYRIPMIRASNSGISAFIQATGKITSQTPLKSATSQVATVSIPVKRSFYAIWGDWFLYLISFIFVLDYCFRHSALGYKGRYPA